MRKLVLVLFGFVSYFSPFQAAGYTEISVLDDIVIDLEQKDAHEKIAKKMLAIVNEPDTQHVALYLFLEKGQANAYDATHELISKINRLLVFCMILMNNTKIMQKLLRCL